MRRSIILLTVTVVVIFGWFIATLVGGDRPALGLDLKGGVSVVLRPVSGSDYSTLDTAAQIIRNRVDALGVAEPDVSRQGNQVVVDLPGAKNQQQALDLVGRTAELRFRPVLTDSGGNPITIPFSSSAAPSPTSTTVHATTTTKPKTTTTKGHALAPRTIDTLPIADTKPPSTTAAKPKTTTPVKGATTTTVPASRGNGTCEDGKLVTPAAQNTAAAQQVILPDRKKQVCYVLGPTLLTGKAIGTASAVIDPSTAQWIVNVHFKNNDFVTKVATPYVGKEVAIVLDQEVVSAPVINQGINGQDVTISGSSQNPFSGKEAHDLALVLRYGSLPVVFTPATSQTVSPTLGKDQLNAGIVAGLIGLGLVALYMIFFYRLLGVVVWTGLALTAMTFFALTTWLSSHYGLTLTLAGVTGIIVSVGVTVDSYVVYFERLKDEVRTGKTVRSSVDTGFRRAFRTIIAADLVSLIGAAVLYVLATSSVKGFALFLGISTLLDLILAFCFMHPMVVLIARRPALVRMPGIGVAAGLDVSGVRA